MRQRRPKNLEEKIEELSVYLVETPACIKGMWRSVYSLSEPSDIKTGALGNQGEKLFLEIGSGKGRFLTELALRNPEDFFLGFEVQRTVIIRALEKIRDNDLNNIRMCACKVEDIGSLFSEDELDGIYLNFIDPWPKDRHEKRRLTSKRYLDGYALSLKPGGFIRLKTDNDELFCYSVRQMESHKEFEITEMSDDLHDSEYNEDNIMTEYESKFSDIHEKINYICANLIE